MPVENQPDLEFPNWEAVEKAVVRVIAESPDPFDRATILNAQDLLHTVNRLCQIPDGVAKGYWSTIRIWWRDIEVEVFDGRYELYRFGDGRMQIEYFDRAPGAEVPAELIDQLPRVAKRPD